MIDYYKLFDKIDLDQDRPALRREIKEIAKTYKLGISNTWRIFLEYRSKKTRK